MVRDNFTTLNADKCHLLASVHTEEAVLVKVGDELIWEEYAAKLIFSVLIDSDLLYNGHVKMICKMTLQTISRMVFL